MLLTLTLPDQTEHTISFSDILGQSEYTILYFYPKDDTPGCTLEAQGFQVLYPEFLKHKTQIIGVSHDPHKSHCKFQTKYGLAFPLIADTELVLHNDERFQTWAEKSMYGKKYMGSLRHTFLLDKTGTLIHKRDKVDTKKHAQEVLDYIHHI